MKNAKPFIAVLGAGESGVGAAILAKKHDFKVFVSDFGTIKEEYKKALIHHGIEWEEGGHSEEKIFSADKVVKSPGIPDSAPIVRRLRANSVRVISEIEFAFQFTNANLIGITGSNGKTTTAELLFYVLKNGGLDVVLGGNIGKSFAGLAAEKNFENAVVELSSFQLDGIETFRPHIAILTNLSPDHLDRYENKYENYIASKFRIVMNQTESDFFIFDNDDLEIKKWLKNNPVRSKLIPFSLKNEVKQGVFKKENKLIINIENDQFIMPISTLGLQGEHNVKNAMAASAAAKLLNIRKQTIRESLESFQGVEHRLEKVRKVRNVLFINDSKATNVNATYYALDSVSGPTVWIVGGVDKGNDYTDLLPLVNEKVKAIVCIGIDNRKIIDTFGNVVETLVEATSMVEAVKVANYFAEEQGTVLLSPACASYDLFENYEDRGRQFKEAVRSL